MTGMQIGDLPESVIVTAGSAYIDIDAYACSVAMSELLNLRGKRAVAFSDAPCNYSVIPSLRKEGQLLTALPPGFSPESSGYVIVDVSDPHYIKDRVPLEKVAAVYDHHTGFEDYWAERLGEQAKIEFIGAAATLIFREWKKAEALDSMSRDTARLLVAAILDNTLDLTSSNTTDEDTDAYKTLCRTAHIGDEWRAVYFSEVQNSVEEDLKNAIFRDIKTIRDSDSLPPRLAQLCVWDAGRIFDKLPQIRTWFGEKPGGWMLNIIDISRRQSCFICDDIHIQRNIEAIFGVFFDKGIAVSRHPYLRKEIIKKASADALSHL